MVVWELLMGDVMLFFFIVYGCHNCASKVLNQVDNADYFCKESLYTIYL